MRLPPHRLQALPRLWMPLALHKSQLELQWWWLPALCTLGLRMSQALLRLWMPLALHKSPLELQWWWWPALHTSQALLQLPPRSYRRSRQRSHHSSRRPC